MELAAVPFVLLFCFCSGFQLPQCSNGWLTIVESSSNSIQCTDIPNDVLNVSWYVRESDSSPQSDIGHCGKNGASDPCYVSSSFPGVRLRRQMADKSELIIVTGHRNFSGQYVGCYDGTSGGAGCTVNVIHKGTVRECSLVVDALNWTITGSCTIEQAFSSRDDYYRCLWYYSQVNQSETTSPVTPEQVFSKTAYLDSGVVYYRGTCSFTQPLPPYTGTYTYSFHFEPGFSGSTSQTLTIEPPGDPQVSCPQYVEEASDLDCACTATSPGQPAALSYWLSTSNSQLKVNSVRRAKNGTQYQCIQRWAGSSPKTVNYTLQVAYGPADEDLVILGPSQFITHGTGSLTLTCQANNTNPRPLYTWTGAPCLTADNTCTFTPRVPEDDGKVVTCTARNVAMSTKTQTATATFNVSLNYPPSSPVITGYRHGETLIAGERVSLTCSVRGGKPPVTNIIFFCQRPDGSRAYGTFDPSSVSNTVTIDTLADSDNMTLCLCDSNKKWLPDPTRSFEARVHLLVALSQRSNIIVLSMNNGTDSLTVSSGASDPVTVVCSARGLPRPSVRLIRLDTHEEIKEDTKSSVGWDANIKQYTLAARCQDTAIYTCLAGNTAGKDERNVTLFVNCWPEDENDKRRRTLRAETGKLYSIVLNVVAYPMPVLRGVSFTRETTVNSSTTERNSTDFVSVSVTSTEFLYKSQCTVTFRDPQLLDEGLYDVTLANPFGDITYTIGLYVDAEDSFSEDVTADDPFPAVAVGGGVAAAAVVVVAVVVGVFLYRRFCGGPNYDRPLPRQQEDNYTGLVVRDSDEHNPGDTYAYLSPTQQETSTYTGLVLYEQFGVQKYTGATAGHESTVDSGGYQNTAFQGETNAPLNNRDNTETKEKTDHTYVNE